MEKQAGKASNLETERAALQAKLDTFEKAAKEKAATARKVLLDAAEKDGRINAETRPIYENLLKEHPEDGKKALAVLPTKKFVKDTLKADDVKDSPWEKRQREIQNKYHAKS